MTSATLLARRLRWSWTAGEEPRPQPVVVLLGPIGAGKTSTLDMMASDCGDAVVHARIDFSNDDQPVGARPTSTVEALAQIADQLSRKWPARGTARFTRFTLGLIAAGASLEHGGPGRDKEALRALIGDVTRDPGPNRGEATLAAIVPRLAWTVGRRPLNQAGQRPADIPGTEGGTLLDALVSLNQRGTSDPDGMTTWLTSAFLADVRDNHPRLARPDPGSPCVCDDRDRRRHWHNWVLLLDNTDHGVGARFLNDLRAARERHLRSKPGDHDALLVIATSGRWNPDWGEDWRPVWLPKPENPDQARTVVRCLDASYEHWRGEPNPDFPPPQYPVLLEPLGISETARILGVNESDERCVFVQRATGGLPAAVTRLAPRLRGVRLRPGARDVLSLLDNPGRKGEDAWLDRLRDLHLTRHVRDIGIREFVTAAPYATAPWLVPADAAELLPRSQVGRIITELRTALWVVAPRHGRGIADHAELHPWVARTLSSALAARPDGADSGYTEQFEAFLASVETVRHDEAHELYCRLALGWFTDVVESFKSAFDTEPHEHWISRLELVTSAPDNLSTVKDRAALFQELIEQMNRSKPDDLPDDRPEGDAAARRNDRPAVGNIVARLVAAKWLAANPFAVPDPDQQNIIVNAYRELAPLSRRADVGALYSAARRAAEARL